MLHALEHNTRKVFHVLLARERMGAVAHWTFLTHHAHVLLYVARNPDATIETLAAAIQITPRSALSILKDLESNGYLERERHGRRNHYVVHPERPLRHSTNAAHTVGAMIEALSDLG